jgi:phage baseplate assembly protein W
LPRPWGADVLEQDSIDEIAQCVQMLVSTNLATRIELPDYGIPDQTFVADPQVNTAVIRSQCATWEPRAEVTLSSTPDQFDELIRNIRLTVEAQVAAASAVSDVTEEERPRVAWSLGAWGEFPWPATETA